MNPFTNILKPVARRFTLLIILSVYIAISHIILPHFGKRHFLFFSVWGMFSFLPYSSVYDISCNNGKGFLFRDLREEIKLEGINIEYLFYILEQKKIEFYNKNYKKAIEKICPDPLLVEIKGSLTEHIFQKKELKIINKL